MRCSVSRAPEERRFLWKRNALIKHLQKAYDELERRMEERTADLVETKEKLERKMEQYKRQEKALNESKEKCRNIFNNAQVGIFRTRISDGKILECNDRFARSYGYETPEECKDDFVLSEHYTDPGTREKMVASLMEKGEVSDIEACFSRKDGNDVWVRFSARAYPEEGYLEGVGYDITEEKRALEALQKSEAQKKSILDASIDVIRLVDKDMKIIWANKATSTELKAAPEQLVGNFCYEAVAGRDTPCPGCPTQKALKSGKTENALIHQKELKGIKGESYWDDYAVPVKNESGDIINFIQISRNITDRRLAAKALRESEEKYRSMMEAMRDPVYICTSDFRVAYMNPAMIKRTGRNATGERCHAAIHGLSKKCPWCVHGEVQNGQSCEVEITSPDEERSYLTSHLPIFHENGTISKMTVYKDITDLKRLQRDLVVSERLAATGQLAASIAHDINSPLQAITILLGMMREQQKGNPGQIENLELITGAFGNIRDTVKRLLDLNRPGKENREQTDVNNLIKKTVELIRPLLRHNKIEINLDLSLEIPNIMISPQQLSQCLLNFFNNAIEAMPGASRHKGGRIRDMTGGEINIRTMLSKGNIVIKVVDNGPGIPEENLHHIFEPFYTRKKVTGIGVGLSISYGFVESHGGTIVAENLPEGGAVFTITLPIEELRN